MEKFTYLRNKDIFIHGKQVSEKMFEFKKVGSILNYVVDLNGFTEDQQLNKLKRYHTEEESKDLLYNKKDYFRVAECIFIEGSELE